MSTKQELISVVEVQQQSGRGVLASVESLRGVAALMVMSCHYYGMLGLPIGVVNFFYIGVNLFFVISGFVFGSYFFEKQVEMRSFIIKRFFRIYPLYIFSLLAYVSLGYVHRGVVDLNAFLMHIAFIQNFHVDYISIYNPAYWSLPIEVGFYIIVLFVARLKFIKFSAIILCFCMYSLTVRLLFFNDILSQAVVPFIIYSVPLWMVDFLFGVFVVYLIRRGVGQNLVKIYFSSAMVVLLLLSVIWVELGGEDVLLLHPILHTTYKFLVPFCFAAILLFFVKNENFFKGFIGILGSFFGALSYGIYLLHNAWPQIFGLLGFNVGGLYNIILSTVLTFGSAFVLHKCIEIKFIQKGISIANKERTNE